MAESRKIKTPRGIAFYPSLNRTERYQGKDTGNYTLKLILSGDALETMTTEVNDFLEEAYGPKKAAKVKSPFKVTKPKEGEDQQTYIVFRAKAVVNDRERKVAIFDSKGKPVEREISLGSGSVVKVNGSMKAFDDEPGIAFYMDAVQVIKYVEYKPAAGFDAEEDEDGFSGDEFDTADKGGFSAEDVDGDEAEEKPTKKTAPAKKRDF